MSADINIASLPRELMRKIVSYLPCPELSNLMLVSTEWREIADDPFVWKQFSLAVDKNNLDILEDILDIYRLGSLQTVKTGGGVFIPANCIPFLFELMTKKTNIKHLDLTNTDVSNVDPEIFAEIINSLEKVNLDMNLFTFSQAVSLFTKMRENTHLLSLSVRYNTLSSVNPLLLAQCLTRLHQLDLTSTHLTTQQVQALFCAMKQETSLVKLTLVEIRITEVGAELFAQCANKLDSLKLTNHNHCCLTGLQITTLFNKAQQQSQLKQLLLQSLDLSAVPPQVFACCINRIGKVSISSCTITSEQATDIFKMMTKDTEIRELGLDGCDLSPVNSDHLASCVNNLSKVDIGNCNLTNNQVTEVLKNLNENAKIKELNIRDNDLSSVDLSVLTHCFKYLRTVNIANTQLKSCQLKAILDNITQGGTLRSLEMSLNNLSCVEPDLLAQAVTKLVTVKLVKTSLTRYQAQTILRHCKAEAAITTECLDREAAITTEYLDISNNQQIGADMGMLAAELRNKRPRMKIYL